MSITSINNFTTGNFVSALKTNTDIIDSSIGLTANEMFINAGINIISARNNADGVVKSEEKKFKQDYYVDFNDFWYPLTKYAIVNMASVVPARAMFAQQLVSQFGIFNFVDLHFLTSIINPSARVFPNAKVDKYNFVPNLIGSIFDTAMFNRTMVIGNTYKFGARFHADFISHDISLGIYDNNYALVESVTATVDTEGFANFTYVPSAVSSGTYNYFALRTFNILNKFVPGVPATYEGLIANITAKQFFASQNIIPFVVA
jgi:hypothetical protein